MNGPSVISQPLKACARSRNSEYLEQLSMNDEGDFHHVASSEAFTELEKCNHLPMALLCTADDGLIKVLLKL